jgi:dTDP-glucose 4,6-dehydratase
MSYEPRNVCITGGAGFIGANFVRHWLGRAGEGRVVVLDALTYAGNPENLKGLERDPRYAFVREDICNEDAVRETMEQFQIDTLVHFAAESHVDRSILGPDDFIRTNVVGTHALLKAAKTLWLDRRLVSAHRFHHVSTDEVYGSLLPADAPFHESSPYAPNSPYSASKAGSDHLVRAYHETFGLQTTITNCSNNYGPYQFPEKLIPLTILNAMNGKPIPVYGDGKNVRDWLYVADHCEAIRTVLARGKVGETYNVGGRNEKPNLEIVHSICSILDELRPKDGVVPHSKLITYVQDRPGHDRRYAMDTRKIERELNWQPRETFETGIRKTVEWYLANDSWIREVTTGHYREWIATQYSV